MTPKRELQIAYGLIIVLFFVGVISYAAFPPKTPEQPIRMMYKSVAGKALFDHKTHYAESGYGLACNECHHHPEEPEEGETANVSCGNCHQTLEKGQKYPESCLDCHEAEDLEESEIAKKSDAIHSQCIGCHKEAGSGPEECNSCHAL
jgi:Class III cytochrome C family